MDYLRLSDATQQSLYAIREQHPNTSIPDGADLSDMGYAPLTATEPPAIDRLTQSLTRDGCELVDGQWQYKWTVTALDAGTVAANQAAHVANIQATIIAATQIRLDEFAQSRHYDGILSACTYASSSVPKFAGEGQYCVDARDATWATLYTIMGEVLAGTRAMPESFADVSPLLPALVWPA